MFEPENLNLKIAQAYMDGARDPQSDRDDVTHASVYALLAIGGELARIAAALEILTGERSRVVGPDLTSLLVDP
jgi:hypothetical protein